MAVTNNYNPYTANHRTQQFNQFSQQTQRLNTQPRPAAQTQRIQAPQARPQTQRMAPPPTQHYQSALTAPDVYKPTFRNAPTNMTHLQARNLQFNILKDKARQEGFQPLKLKIPYMDANLVDATPQTPMDLDNEDFDIHVKASEIRLSDVDASMTVGSLLANNETLPVKDFRVVFAPNNKVQVEGKIKKFGITLPVKVDAAVSATPAGDLKVDLEQLKLLGIPLKGVMDTFGISLEKVLKMNDPSTGLVTKGNSAYVDLTGLTTEPGIRGKVRGVNTHLGHVSLIVGDTIGQAQHAHRQAAKPSNQNYMELQGGHIYYNGYFVKDGDLRLDDKTPNSNLIFGNEGEMLINIRKGKIGLHVGQFNSILAGEIGEGGSFSGLQSKLLEDRAEIKGKMWGFVPIKLDMFFNKTDDGRLYFAPKNAKAFGFIPLPDSFLQKKIQDMIKSGVPYKDGVALNGVGDITLGGLQQVWHQNDYIIMDINNQGRSNTAGVQVNR